MSSTSQALKRLGVGSVTVATVLAMPYVGVASAFAATPTDPVATILSQQTNSASPRNDGTDTTVKISANVVYTPSSTASDNTNAPAGVKFSYTPTGGAAVVIGTDSTFPYSINWAPPTGGGAFTLTAQPVLANGTSVGTPGSKTTTVVDAPTVHISSPAEGGSIGVFKTTSATPTYSAAVSGTRSADLPALSVKAATRDNSTGTLSTYGTATVVPATGGQNWNAAVAVPACAAPSTSTCDVVIYAATTGGTAQTDEVTEATEYAQTLTTVTVAPASANIPAGSTQNYTVTVLDQNGKPVAGLKVNGTSSNHAVAADPGTQPTDGSGVATFPVATTTTPGSSTLTFQTWSNGASYVSTVDFSRTATLTTYASTPTTATLTAAPSKSVYAEQSEYTIDGASTDFPQVKFCVTDQNGQSTPAGVGQAPVLTDSRRDSTTAASAPAVVAPVTATPIAGTGCYYLDLPTATGTYGTDTVSGYFEQNGTPGQQAGDPAAAPLVLNYGNLGITALDTQAQKGTNVTVSFQVLDANKRPFANRAVTLTTGAAGTFTSTQPTGTGTTPPAGSGASVAPNTLYATTDANGVVSATVNSATMQIVQVTATDDLTTATQKATSVASTAKVDFRDQSVALTTLSQSSAGTLVQPVGSTATAARPGDVIDGIQYTLKDVNGGLLKNVSVAVSLDHGFFTGPCALATPNPQQYTNCSLAPAPADGAPAGGVANAKTATLTSDSNGVITFSMSIARDAAFDVDGTVVAALTAVANGGTKAADVATFTTKGIEPINGGSVKLVPVDPTKAVSGDVQVATYQPSCTFFSCTSSTLTQNNVKFAVHVTDQFGNLVQLPTSDKVDLTSTGGTIGTTANATTATAQTAQGSYTGGEVPYFLESSTTSTSGTPATVTAAWNAPVTNYKAMTTGVAPNTTTTYTTVAGATAKKTDSFTVNFYAIDLKNLAYSFTSTPGNTVPVNTAVTTSATVKDQKGNPVQGLTVQFVRSGPNDAAGNSQNGGSTTQLTNTEGKAGTSYSSGTPGTATVTVIVTDSSGNELSRGVQNVTFTKGTPTGGLSITATKGTIIAGQLSTIVVTGTPGVAYDVVAANRPSSVFVLAHQGIIGANGTSSFTVHPLNNVNFIARQSGAASSQIIIAVHTGLNIGVKKVGHVVTFYGQIYPNNRAQTVYIYTGSTRVGAATRDASGKNWTFTHNFSSAAGQSLVFYSYTASDTQNANGHSQNLRATL